MPKTPRRFALMKSAIVLAGWVLLAGQALSARAQTPSPEAATSFIDSTVRRLVTIIDANESLASQQSQLQAVVDGAVDVEGIARFCLGRYWPAATPAQREQFMTLFHAVLLEGVTGQIRAYKGVTVTLGRAQPRDAGVSVSSVVQRPGKGPANADWLVAGAGGGLKIEDVVAEGTSLRLTRRNDYTTFLGSHGGNIDALLAAMRQRAAQ